MDDKIRRIYIIHIANCGIKLKRIRARYQIWTADQCGAD